MTGVTAPLSRAPLLAQVYNGSSSKKHPEYAELLGDTIFAVSPPGDVWEAFRTWEAMESGAIPVIEGNAIYKGYVRPARPLLEITRGVLSVSDWNSFPDLLEAYTKNFSALQELQDDMLSWIDGYKVSLRRQIHNTAVTMRASAVPDAPRGVHWRPRTTCKLTPLTPQQVIGPIAALAPRGGETMARLWRGEGQWTCARGYGCECCADRSARPR